jgi:hypothetical protein
MWAGLGFMKKKVVLLNSRQEEQLPFTPEIQSKFFKTPPCLPKSKLALLQRNRLMMLSVLEMYFQEEIKKNKVTDADEDEDNNLDATITRINSEDNRDEKHKNCLLKYFSRLG